MGALILIIVRLLLGRCGVRGLVSTEIPCRVQRVLVASQACGEFRDDRESASHHLYVPAERWGKIVQFEFWGRPRFGPFLQV